MAKYVPLEKLEEPGLTEKTANGCVIGGWVATIGGAIGAACSKGIAGKAAWAIIAWLGNVASGAGVLDLANRRAVEYTVELPDPEEEVSE